MWRDVEGRREEMERGVGREGGIERGVCRDVGDGWRGV